MSTNADRETVAVQRDELTSPASTSVRRAESGRPLQRERMLFTDREAEYLDAVRLGRLATVHPDGTLQVNPVSCYLNGELQTIDIGGHNMAASRKFRNVLANGRVALVIDDMPSIQPLRVRCIEIRGQGEALREPGDSAARIPGSIIRIRPRRIVSWGVDPEASGKRHVPTGSE